VYLLSKEETMGLGGEKNEGTPMLTKLFLRIQLLLVSISIGLVAANFSRGGDGWGMYLAAGVLAIIAGSLSAVRFARPHNLK